MAYRKRLRRKYPPSEKPTQIAWKVARRSPETGNGGVLALRSTVVSGV